MEREYCLVLLGLDFKSPNFGCAALGYSFLQILKIIAKEQKCSFKIYSVNYHKFIAEAQNELKSIVDLQVHYKSMAFYKSYIKVLKLADYVFDFTGGDSFTDIYGMERFVKETFLKELAIHFNGKLILGPQTIGPFSNIFAKAWSTSVMKRSKKVYVRDLLSKEYADRVNVKTEQTTDIAFFLPEETVPFFSPSHVKKVGFNVSALMNNNGYSQTSSFQMKINYGQFCDELINKLENDGYEVYLIAHVFSEDREEDDFALCKDLHQKHPGTVLAPKFLNPMQAKSYMSHMNCVIGSRMHAMIGAFSMGIPVIAVSYSRKFQGLFKSLGYAYVIDAKTCSTDFALRYVYDWISDIGSLAAAQQEGLRIAEKEVNAFIENLRTLF